MGSNACGALSAMMLRATHQSSDSLNAVVRSNAVISDVTKSMSREWLSFGRERAEQNFSHLKHLLRCRTPQDLTALQSESLRANLESFLQCARLIAQQSWVRGHPAAPPLRLPVPTAPSTRCPGATSS